MTLREYRDELNKFIEENPDTLDMLVITSKDDEGNGFNPVHYTPSKGFFKDGEYVHKDDFADYQMREEMTNSVCLN